MKKETRKLEVPELPPFLPHGWKKEVARLLGVHHNTVSNAIKAGKGPTYEKVKRTAAIRYGSQKTKQA